MVLRARLRLAGHGVTAIGLMRGNDFASHVEVRFDSDTAPYFYLVSWAGGVETVIPAAVPTSYLGVQIDLRLIKTGTQYRLVVNGVSQATVTNPALGDAALRPYLAVEGCAGVHAGDVLSYLDRVEMLTDRDGDGLGDLAEDPNVNGVIDPGETDPLDPDSDADTMMDGLHAALERQPGRHGRRPLRQPLRPGLQQQRAGDHGGLPHAARQAQQRRPAHRPERRRARDHGRLPDPAGLPQQAARAERAGAVGAGDARVAWPAADPTLPAGPFERDVRRLTGG